MYFIPLRRLARNEFIFRIPARARRWPLTLFTFPKFLSEFVCASTGARIRYQRWLIIASARSPNLSSLRRFQLSFFAQFCTYARSVLTLCCVFRSSTTLKISFIVVFQWGDLWNSALLNPGPKGTLLTKHSN
ncbi:unnamed protein product [Ceratitis capitata]|uniref:(Mediterranean fruit fly) hypothetical protein n=1 Tax=Ceratitis capitata TaxID=7213 RepID=A0A811UUF5_CERCA|nr:unnamed protein product [Ceratitis capitata]